MKVWHLGGVEMAIIMEAAGERLLTSPLFAVTQSTALLNVCLQSAVRDRCLADIASGHIVSLALTQRGGWLACLRCLCERFGRRLDAVGRGSIRTVWLCGVHIVSRRCQ